MLGEKFILKNKKNSNIRNLLLIITILFFLVFIIVFISSFRQYKNIQQRIQNIYETVHTDNEDFLNILTKYNEAEHFFRLFTIDSAPKNYNAYELKLHEIHFTIDSLVQNFESGDNSDFEYITDIEKRKKLSRQFMLLKVKLRNIIDSAISLNYIPAEIPVNELDPIKINKNYTKTSTTNAKPNFIVVEKKPFIKRLFGKQKDTIKFNEIESYNTEKEEIVKNFETDIKAINLSAQKKIKEIKTSYEQIRQKERQLLAVNFRLLYEINRIIHNIQELKLDAKNESTTSEVKSLLDKSNTFKWQITFCLIFMFAMICIIIYYQFFTKYYEEKLIDERIYASKLAKEKTDILAEITHEIRTPINSLIGIIDLLRKKDHLYDKKEVVLLDSIYSNIINTSKTINDILNLSKIDQDSTSNFTTFNVNDLTEEIIEMHQNQAKLKNIYIAYEKLNGNQSVIYSDDFKIRQILTNLVSNAIKYSEKGTVTIFTKIDDQSNLIIEVQDEGIGIPAALQDNVYRKYYTVNKALKLDAGVGLGLFITKKLILSLNGKINFISKKQNGTIFKVEIPIPKSNVSSTLISKILTIEDFPKDLSWLIVDDNALNLLYMKQFFEHSPNLKTAANGHQAFNIIQSQHIDIVITDINMPIMTGDQLLMELRNKKEFDHIKVIATSSDNEQVKELEKLHGLKFDGILIKPFNEKKLTETIDYTLRSVQRGNAPQKET